MVTQLNKKKEPMYNIDIPRKLPPQQFPFPTAETLRLSQESEAFLPQTPTLNINGLGKGEKYAERNQKRPKVSGQAP